MSEKITVIITFESQEAEIFTRKLSDKIKDTLKSFASKLNKSFKDLLFLYSGNKIEIGDMEKTFEQIMNSQAKEDGQLHIIAYESLVHQGNVIKIIFIFESAQILKIEGEKEEKLKDIFNRCKEENKLDLCNYDLMMFKYGDKAIDLNNKFDDIANKYDKKCLGMTILVYKKNPIKVNFIQEKAPIYSIECFMEDKIQDIINKYCSSNALNLSNLSFAYKAIPINNTQKTFNDLVIDKNTEVNESKILILKSSRFQGNTKMHIDITVISKTSPNKMPESENPIISSNINSSKQPLSDTPFQTTNQKKRTCIAITTLIVIILIIIIVAVVVIVLSKKKDENNDDTTYENTEININPTYPEIQVCDPGFYIPEDDITQEDCNSCSIEGCITCFGTYDNNECTNCGEDSIAHYENGKIIQCEKKCRSGPDEDCMKCNNDINKCEICNIGYNLVNATCRPDFFIKAVYETVSPGQRIDLIYSTPSDIKHMIIDGVKFTPNSKDYQFENKGEHIVYIQLPSSGLSINFLFLGIKYLKYVIFSDFDEYQPKLNFNRLFEQCENLVSVDLSKIAFLYSADFSFMFTGCRNLKNVNFKLDKIIAGSTGWMFYNCTSLTSIDISRIDLTNAVNLYYMFKGCISLEIIKFSKSKLEKAETMTEMFYDCNSLKSIDLSEFKPTKMSGMLRMFYNCYSLTSINLVNFYTHDVTSMESLFYNCTSLKKVDLTYFNTQKVINMKSVFQNCTSLELIIFGNNFYTNEVTIIDYIFYNCHSLTSIDISLNMPKVYSLSNMFYNCFNLKSIDLSKFIITSSTYHYEYMFYGCYSLTSIDFAKLAVELNNVYMNGIFNDCPNLRYVNITNVLSSADSKLFNLNISSSGKIIFKKTYYDYKMQYITDENKIYLVPSGWNYELLE